MIIFIVFKFVFENFEDMNNATWISHPSRTHEFTSGFLWGLCYSTLNFLYVVLWIIVCLSSFFWTLYHLSFVLRFVILKFSWLLLLIIDTCYMVQRPGFKDVFWQCIIWQTISLHRMNTKYNIIIMSSCQSPMKVINIVLPNLTFFFRCAVQIRNWNNAMQSLLWKL